MAHLRPPGRHRRLPGQRPAGRRRDQGILRLQPAFSIHGSDQPAQRADSQAPAEAPSAPGGSGRERAGFDVRRRPPPATTAGSARSRAPEGPSIGLIGSLASYAKVNEFGFVETPFRRVYNRLDDHQGELGAAPGPDPPPSRGRREGTGDPAAPVPALDTATHQPNWARPRSRSVDIHPFVSEGPSASPARRGGRIRSPEAYRPEPNGTFTDARVPGSPGRPPSPSPTSPTSSTWTSRRSQIVSIAAVMIPFPGHGVANPGADAPTCRSRRCRCSCPTRRWWGPLSSATPPRTRAMIVAPNAGVVLGDRPAARGQARGNANPVFEDHAEAG